MDVIKPENCTCGYPHIVSRNMVGHDQTCPVYIEWWENTRRLTTERIQKENAETKQAKYLLSDNVE